MADDLKAFHDYLRSKSLMKGYRPTPAFRMMVDVCSPYRLGWFAIINGTVEPNYPPAWWPKVPVEWKGSLQASLQGLV